MIKFYLTGALVPNGFQNNPASCIGAYMSSVTLNNGDIDTLFGGVSQFLAMNKKPEYAIVALKNVGKLKTQIKVTAIQGDSTCLSTIDIALVEPTLDDDGNILFEQISDKYAAPYYADFANGQTIELPKLPKDKVYGLWIKRTIKSPIPVISNDNLVAAFDGNTPLPQEDTLSIKIEYSEQ